MRNSVELREERLAQSWGALRPETTLETVSGEAVRVRFPGRRNTGPGPDFLDAVLETEGGEVRGAIEVHQRTSDWQRHGHGADPAYRDVVLHVVGKHDGAASRPPGGAQLPLLELVHPEGRGEAGGPTFPCAAREAPDAALTRVGSERFEANVRRLASALRGREDALDQLAFEEIAVALGYARNSAPLGELATAFPLTRVRAFGGCQGGGPGSAVRAEALLLGGAGLLPSQRHLPARRRRDAYAETLERVWSAAELAPALRAYRWDHGQSRPENGPVRRVVGLAHLALKWPAGGMPAALRGALTAPRSRNAAHTALAALVSLPCPDGYWLAHWEFGVAAHGSVGGALEQRAGNEAPALVGLGRAADVVVNVLLPLAAVWGDAQGDEELQRAARSTYAAHPPLMENWITRLVRERSGVAGSLGACAQQGLIHVYEQACHALRCGACALGPAAETDERAS